MPFFSKIALFLCCLVTIPCSYAQSAPDSLIYVQLLDTEHLLVDSFSVSLMVENKAHPLAFVQKRNLYHVFLIPPPLRTKINSYPSIVVQAPGYVTDTIPLQNQMRTMAYFFQPRQAKIKLNGVTMPFVPMPQQYVIFTQQEDNKELLQLLEKHHMTIKDTVDYCAFFRDFYYCKVLVEAEDSLLTYTTIYEFRKAGYFMGVAFVNYQSYRSQIKGLQPFLHLGFKANITQLESIEQELKKAGFSILSYQVIQSYGNPLLSITIQLPTTLNSSQFLQIVNQKLQNIPNLQYIQPDFIEGVCPG